jgi:hypothetical protein
MPYQRRQQQQHQQQLCTTGGIFCVVEKAATASLAIVSHLASRAKTQISKNNKEKCRQKSNS